MITDCDVIIQEDVKRCSKCILPSTFPDIKFDKNGVCNKCHESDKKYIQRDYKALGEQLEKILYWVKAQNKRFDCIVPFSGGKDSSYVMYLCKKKYGLKVLAVNFNNGLRTIEALKNIEKITKKLDIAYVCYGPNWNLMKKLYREFLLKTGQFCFPCDMGIWATVHKVAEQYHVPLIISGYSAQIESRDSKIYSYSNKLFKTITKGLVTNREMNDFLESTKAARLFKRIKHFRLTRYRRQISLPDYIVWDDKEIKRAITEELGWEKRADGSSDHIDCLFAPIKGYLNVQKWGFGEKTTKFSAMIRSGELFRSEGLKLAEQEEKKDLSEIIARFIEMVGVNHEDLGQAKEKDHLPYM
ncbi:N-acetyl sugar amidotransferase [Candidatus Omnitrophota bacterium]